MEFIDNMDNTELWKWLGGYGLIALAMGVFVVLCYSKWGIVKEKMLAYIWGGVAVCGLGLFIYGYFIYPGETAEPINTSVESNGITKTEIDNPVRNNLWVSVWEGNNKWIV